MRFLTPIRGITILLIAALALVTFSARAEIKQASPKSEGPVSVIPPSGAETGMFRLSILKGKKPTSLRVFYVRPSGYRPDTPVVFVMHGIKRNADDYRDNWIKIAEKHNLLVVVPELTKRAFPGSRAYNRGNVFSKNGRLNPPEKWTFSIIKRVFEKTAFLTGSVCRNFSIFGHSAGAQFVHRMVTLFPQSDIDVAIAANSGLYTFPLFSVKWPYGLRGTPINKKGLRAALSRKLILLLGERDKNPNHKYLPKSPEAMAQGPHRLARGHYFYDKAKKEAARLGTPFHWEKMVIKNVGHSNRAMAKWAAKLFSERSICKTGDPGGAG